ncbi:hypothetical protein DXG01_002527 [Tephrocybe rancida]|nr:hypothetical protein DXG01_002527 [Tephrocybe rancida]
MAKATSPTSDAPLPRPKKSQSPVVRYYLVAFNILSALGWTYLLILTVAHLLNIDGRSAGAPAESATASSAFTRVLQSLPFLKSPGAPLSFEARLPEALRPVYRRAGTAYVRLGTPTALVQSLALMEVAHVLLGWVKSPLPTTAMQVASRLYIVWGIVEQYADVRTSPIYTSMLLSWSLTEVIRYSFYALSLLSHSSSLITYLRYTTFYVLYPTGASSEALLIYATLPRASPVPGWRSWIDGMWTLGDYARGVLFLIWWPCLYIMYTYMMSQRRKVLGSKGRRPGSKGEKAN